MELSADERRLSSRYRAVFDKYKDIQTTLAMEENDGAGALLVVDPANFGQPAVPNRAAITGLGALAGFALCGMTVVGLNRRQRQALA
jgi:hypothetical protein